MGRWKIWRTPGFYAYLVAVGVGCSFVGVLIGIYDVFRAGNASPSWIVYLALVAPIFGFLPGLILAFPGLLFSLWIRQLFGRLYLAWYWLLGLSNGVVVSLPISIAIAHSGRTGTLSELLVAAFAIAGGCAGLVFYMVEATLNSAIDG